MRALLKLLLTANGRKVHGAMRQWHLVVRDAQRRDGSLLSILLLVHLVAAPLMRSRVLAAAPCASSSEPYKSDTRLLGAPRPSSAPGWSSSRRAVPTPRQRPGSAGGSWGRGGMGTAGTRSDF